MGEFFEIGLQAGKEVAVKVDALIAELHRGDSCGENFDPKKRMELSDGSTAYMWYQKWNPFLYQDQNRLLETILSFSDDNRMVLKDPQRAANTLLFETEEWDYLEDDDEDIEKDYAYKLVCVGDEGGYDDYSNKCGRCLFDGLYQHNELTMPEEFCEEKNEALAVLNELINMDYDREESCRVFTSLYDGPGVQTYQAFEEIACAYMSGNTDVRKGIDSVLRTMLSLDFKEIAEKVKEAVDATA